MKFILKADDIFKVVRETLNCNILDDLLYSSAMAFVNTVVISRLVSWENLKSNLLQSDNEARGLEGFFVRMSCILEQARRRSFHVGTVIIFAGAFFNIAAAAKSTRDWGFHPACSSFRKAIEYVHWDINTRRVTKARIGLFCGILFRLGT